MNAYTVVISGTLVFVIGQCIQRFLFQPYIDYFKCKSKLRSTLFMYRRFLLSNNVKETKVDEGTTEIRRATTELESAYYSLPLVGLIAATKALKLPKDKQFNEALEKIIGMLNTAGTPHAISRNTDEFYKLLKLLRYKSPQKIQDEMKVVEQLGGN